MAVSLPDLRAEATRLHQAGDLPAAARAYARYLALRPDDAGIWSNLGVLHRAEGRHRVALKAQRKATALQPDDTGLLNNLANILSDLGQYDASIEIRHRILRTHPDEANHKTMIGRCHRGKGDYAAAIDWLEAARADHPDDAEFDMQLAFARLGAGDYRQGLEDYKSRWRAGELTPRALPFAEWTGQPLKGKTIVVLPEQGFGDAVLFSRFLPVLKGRGARVLAFVEKPLFRLMQGLGGADLVTSEIKRSDPIDYWVNMMDLAALHFRDSDTVPSPVRLAVPEDSTARARALTAPHDGRYKVGVVWSGSATYKGNAFRSFSHRDLMPLTELDGVQIFSLYKGPFLDAFHADGSDAFMIDAGSSDRDFADCAAMMQAMDLVITSDTATAHIAGSLGVPCWTVLHWDAFWVWRHHGETTEWYPGMRLFRQEVPLEWDNVMSDVAEALRARVSGMT